MAIMCKCCGEREAICKGMCKRCYCHVYYRERHPEPSKLDKLDKCSDETKLIIAEYVMGTKQADLARKYGISRQRVNQIIKKVKK